MSYVKTCPYCGTTLSINQLSVEKTASRCPHCNNLLLLTDYGETIKKPFAYKCHKCGEESIYEHPVPYVHCDKCGTLYITSKQGTEMIEAELLSKGDKGELPFKKKKDYYIGLRNKWRMLPNTTKGVVFALIAAIIVIGISGYILSLPPNIETTKAYADMENVWKEFREKNPYNIQIEGLKQYEDHSYVAILSEPSENVSEKELMDFFDSYNCSFTTFKKKIGYDGWLRDAVVCFNDLDEDDIPKFSKKLSKLLYGTEYKAALMNLDVIPEHTAFSSFDLNFQVTEEELRKWFIEDDEQLVNVDDSTGITTLRKSLASSGMQMLLSKTAGFVLWVMDIGSQSSDGFKIMARKFSLDSDLILGAISNDSRVAIIGRERCVPIYELPPMRVETLCLLASAADDELAQSYERTSLYAGKLKGGKDYAPIFLSPQLWHTEYGSTLNVTDQMLKSWSENGMIDYIDFDYPKPIAWAFNEGAMEDLGVRSLTYNWNTDGVGYIVDDDSYSIYAVNRTGSLPVSYIPGNTEGIGATDPVYRAEETAYDFFSNLSSPELVKVVQYAAMYQIFHNIDISVPSKDVDESQLVEVPDNLKENAYDVLKKIASLDKDTRQKIAADYDGVKIMGYDEYSKSDKYRWGFVMPGRLAAATLGKKIEDLYALADYKDYIDKIDTLSAILSRLSDDETLMKCLGNFLTDRNASIEYTSSSPSYNIPNLSNIALSNLKLHGNLGTTNPDPGYVTIELPSFSSKEERIGYAMSCLSRYGYEIQHFNFSVSSLSRDDCMKIYVDENRAKCSEWIKCPTIVQSWSLVDSVNQVGGHNLNSKVSRFKVNRDLKPGQTRTIEKNGKKIVEVSASDAHTRVGDPAYLRRYGRLADTRISGKEIPIRPKSVITKDVAQRTARGFNTNDHLTIKLDVKSGHTINGKKYSSLEELLKDAGASLEEGKAQFKQIEIDGLKDAGVDVDVFIDGVVGKMRKGSCASIPMSKYDFAHYSVAYEGEKAIVTIPIKAGKIEFGSTSNVIKAGLGGSSEVKPTMNVKGGEVVFKVPKNKLQAFLQLIEEFLVKQKGNWNEFKIKMEMKRRGINPIDCEERTKLKVAKTYIINKFNSLDYVWTIQEKTIA